MRGWQLPRAFITDRALRGCPAAVSAHICNHAPKTVDGCSPPVGGCAVQELERRVGDLHSETRSLNDKIVEIDVLSSAIRVENAAMVDLGDALAERLGQPSFASHLANAAGAANNADNTNMPPTRLRRGTS